MRRRSFLTGTALSGVASLVPAGWATASQPPDQLPPVPPLPPTVPPLPPTVPTEIGDVLKLVGELRDVLLLGTLVRLDGEPMFALADGIAYADMPGNPHPTKLPHGAELIRYKLAMVKRIARTGDAELTATMRVLIVPVDAAGRLITQWRNPIDGFQRPVPPSFLRDYKQVTRVVDGRLQVGTPDLVAEVPAAAQTPASTLLWSFSTIKSHNLTERLGIGEDYGFAGNVTESITQDSHIGLPGLLPTLPVATPVVRQLAIRQPFPPELALKPTEVAGQADIRSVMKTIAGIDELPAWLRDLIRTEYPDLLAAPSGAGEQWDDTRWSAFYRDHLEPHQLTWAEWCESSIIRD